MFNHNYWQNLYAKDVRENPRRLPITWLWDAFMYTPKPFFKWYWSL